MITGMIGKPIIALGLVALLMLTAACTPPVITENGTPQTPTTPTTKPGQEGTTPDINWGILEIRVTDPPPADVKSAVVYLTDIEVHRVSDNESKWTPVLGAPPSFDLMDIIGVAEILGSANLTAGSFTQIRMNVDRVQVVTTDGANFTAQVPGDKLKIIGPFNIGAGKVTVLTLDFDGKKSLVLTGKGKALFKPVVKLLISEREQEQEQEQERAQEREGTKFEGTIVAISGDNWTMTIGGKTWMVDVNEAEITGEPAVGRKAEIKGTTGGNTIVAREVEIKPAGN